MKTFRWTYGNTLITFGFTLALSVACIATVLGYWLGALILGIFLVLVRTDRKYAPIPMLPLIIMASVAMSISGIFATIVNPFWNEINFFSKLVKTIFTGEMLLIVGVSMTWIFMKLSGRTAN